MTENKSVKKLAKVGQGLVVFLTREANKIGWKEGSYLIVETSQEGKEFKITLKKAII